MSKTCVSFNTNLYSEECIRKEFSCLDKSTRNRIIRNYKAVLINNIDKWATNEDHRSRCILSITEDNNNANPSQGEIEKYQSALVSEVKGKSGHSITLRLDGYNHGEELYVEYQIFSRLFQCISWTRKLYLWNNN